METVNLTIQVPADVLAVYKKECKRRFPELGDEAPQKILSLIIDSIAAPDNVWTLIIPNIPLEVYERWKQLAGEVYGSFYAARANLDVLPEWIRDIARESLQSGRLEPDDLVGIMIYGLYFGATQIQPDATSKKPPKETIEWVLRNVEEQEMERYGWKKDRTRTTDGQANAASGVQP